MNYSFYRSPDDAGTGGAATKDAQTDDTKLAATDTVYVSPDGGDTDEPFPKPNVEYDFCVDVTNAGKLPSGPFYVRFTLSGDQDPPKDLDFQQEAGLDAGASVKAVMHFGSFPNTYGSYQLDACIYSPTAPERSINCAGSFGIVVNSDSSGSDNNSSASGDGTDAANANSPDSKNDSPGTNNQV